MRCCGRRALIRVAVACRSASPPESAPFGAHFGAIHFPYPRLNARRPRGPNAERILRLRAESAFSGGGTQQMPESAASVTRAVLSPVARRIACSIAGSGMKGSVQ